MRGFKLRMNSKNGLKNSNKIYRGLALTMIFIILFITLASCSTARVHELAEYDDYGANIAQDIARNYPIRVAGSEAETATANYIKGEFAELGYRYEEQMVSLSNGSSTNNIIVNIPGKGFVASESSDEDLDYEVYDRRARPEEGLFHRQVIVAARYDTDPNAAEGNQGASDNASGVGALLTLAKSLKEYSMGYDIVLIALGGGWDNYAGARAYASTMTEDDIWATDVFYEFRSLYSGDRLYSSAGWSSTYPNQKYRLRQTMYELADLAIDNNVYAYTGEALYQNQSSLPIPNPLLEEAAPAGMASARETVVFKEISSTNSDYRVFDQLGIPIVLMESYNFQGESLDDFVESVDPNYSSTGNMVRSTAFDNLDSLREFKDADLLENRINAAAYIVLKGIESGVIGARTDY